MNKMGRTKAATLNSAISLLSQTAGIIVQFISVSIFIKVFGADFLGLNGLFTNILSYLNFAELGIGAALTYALFKPLSDGDDGQVAAIMRFIQKVYRMIALVISIGGVAVLPFVPNLIKNQGSNLSINIYIAFLIALTNVVVSYLVSYKRTLLIADQKNYVNTVNTVIFTVGGQIIQIIVMLFLDNYYVYLTIQVILTLLSNLRISQVVNKQYTFLNNYPDVEVDKSIIKYIKKNVTGMASAKLGGIIVSGTDSLLLSFYVGLRSVALYANYTLIIMGLTQIMSQMLSAVTSSIGNLGVSNEGKEKEVTIFYKYFSISSLLSILVAVGFVSFVSAFVKIWVGSHFVYTALPLFVIGINFLLQMLRQSLINYTNAYGLFWNERWKPIFESIVNFIVSWSLVSQFNMNITGVLIGTITSNILVNFVWESWVVLHYGLHEKYGAFFKLYVGYTVLGFILVSLSTLAVLNFEGIKLINGILISVVMMIISFIAFIGVDYILYPKNFAKFEFKKILNILK